MILRRFTVHSVLWRNYLDWAVINLPFYLYPVLELFWTIFFFFLAGSARRTIRSNLAIVLPGSSRLINYLRAFRTFHNYAWTISEAAIYKLINGDFSYEIIGNEWLEKLGAGKGAIVLTAHMGSYDLGAGLFAEKFNREIRLVRAPEPDQQSAEHLSASLEKTREGAVKIEYNTAGAMLSFDLLNALRQGDIVSIQGDRVEGEVAEIPARVFEKQVRLPNGPFVLAQVANVPIYPLFIVRSGYRRYQIIVHEPLVIVRSERDRRGDIDPAVIKWCRLLEQLIVEHWDQWFAFTPGFLSND